MVCQCSPVHEPSNTVVNDDPGALIGRGYNNIGLPTSRGAVAIGCQPAISPSVRHSPVTARRPPRHIVSSDMLTANPAGVTRPWDDPDRKGGVGMRRIPVSALVERNPGNVGDQIAPTVASNSPIVPRVRRARQRREPSRASARAALDAPSRSERAPRSDRCHGRICCRAS
jgi:hypothetical protein